ncbi:MAG: hypothetical protein QFB87_01855 [Patescibacteria group bacterium]|nr:hypothetical protein [Patescibacteria group bacterium]
MKPWKIKSSLGLVFALFFVFITTVSTSAAINPQINFQGKITNPDGTNLTNGSYSIRFRLYSDPSLDGANACSANTCMWEETKSVTLNDGIFQTSLGDTTTLPGSVDFNNSAIYLGIKVATDSEMTPRVRFTASPYAFNSDKVGGFTAAQLVQLTPASQQSGTINVSGSITTAAAAFIQGAATLGSTTGNGQLKFLDGTADGFSGTIQLGGTLSASQTFTLPTSGGAICVSTPNNCNYQTAGSYETTTGTDFVRNQNGSAQTTANFWISGSGRADTSLLAPSLDAAAIGTLSIGTGTANALSISKTGVTTTINGSLTVTQASTFNGSVSISGTNTLTVGTGATSLGGTLAVTGTTTLTGALTADGGITDTGAFSQTGTGTFGTGTGAVSLNGATAITGTNTLTVGTGATSFGGSLTVTGITTLSGGSSITGATTINTTGTATTAIGNATGTFALASSALNVSTTGAVSGVTTLSASSTITGLTLNGTSGINTGAVAGTQRIDASGNLVNIGNLTTSGASTFTTTGATGITIKPGSEAAAAFLLQNAAGVSFIAFNSTTSTLNVGPTTANAGTLNVATGAAVQAVTIGSTNTTSSTTIQGGATGSINIGSTGSSTLSSTVNIGSTSNATGTQIVVIGSNANAANSVDIDAGNTGLVQIGDSTTAHTIKIGTAGTAAGSAQNITIGSNTTTTASLLTLQGSTISTTNGNTGVVIGGGFSTSDTNLTALTLDSTSTLSEVANTCSATVNNGALYYNSNAGSNAIRACVAGGWEDLISTAGAFFTFFGVVPDSGTVPGDTQALSTAAVSGPCRVYWATATTVGVQACTAYSGGRKVSVTANTSITITTTNNAFTHICLSGTNNQPVASTASTTESANLTTSSFPNANSPIVCLADVKTSASAINAIYDTRVFTTTTKEFGYAAAALPLGVMVKPDTVNANRLALPGTVATGFMRGVVVASNGAAWASGGPNVIIATGGLASIKATAGTMAAASTVQNSTTTSGYAITVAAASAMAYGNLGIAQNSFFTTCTTAATCTGSLLTDLRLR